MRTRPRHLPARLPLLCGVVLSLAGVALGQGEGGPPALAPLDEQVKSAVGAPYLKPSEAAALRLKHGQPTADDLVAPARRAVHALQRGAYTDLSLIDAAAHPLDRAEAAVVLGRFAEAEALLAGDPGHTLRGVRLAAQMWLVRGDNSKALASAKQGADLLAGMGEKATADDLVESVLCRAVAVRLVDPAEGGADHSAMMGVLSRAREMDPLSWRVPLTEAQLLLEKDNYTEARAAAGKALSHNPACAAAYALLGHMSVNTFNTDGVAEAAAVLDRLAAMGPLTDEAPVVGGGAGSLEAAFVRARGALRQSDPDGAEEALRVLGDRFGQSPLVAQVRCAVLAARFDPEGLQAGLADYASRFGQNAGALALVGQTLSDLRQYQPAAERLQQAVALAPFWGEPRVTLGLVLVQAGRDEEARVALEGATRLDPFNVRAANSLKLVREIAAYARVETEHFIVRSRPGLDGLLAGEIARVMEENHARVCGEKGLRYTPKDKTFIDLMPDHAWFAVRIAGMPRIHTIAASTGPVIAMEAPRTGKGHTGLYDWPRVLRHEYAHTVGLARTGNRVPHWFTEAQAQVLEESPRDFNTALLLARAWETGTLFDFSEINLAFTRPKKPTDRAQAYAQGQWMYEYMVERFGGEGPLKLMDLFAAGVREEEAVQRTFGVSRAQFLEDFKVWAGKQLTEWGMRTPEGLPSMAELVGELPRAEGSEEPATPTRAQLAAMHEKYPGHPDVLRLLLRVILEDEEESERATNIELLRLYADLRPVDPFPHQQLARIYLQWERVSEALPHLEWLDARETTGPVYARQLAGLYARLSPPDWERAGVKAERAARIAPYDGGIRELAATVAVQRKDYATARTHLTFLAALEPDSPQHAKRLEALTRLESTGR